MNFYEETFLKGAAFKHAGLIKLASHPETLDMVDSF